VTEENRIAELVGELTFHRGPDILLVRKMREGGLTDDQIVIALEAITSICWSCWDADAGCFCWNDE